MIVGRRLALGGGLASAMAARPAAAAGRVRLRLLETSDLHMYARDFDYYHDRTDPTVGLSKVAALIGLARREAVNSMLFDNGDIIQGSPLGDYIARPGGLRPGAAHPFLKAMGALGYDAATLGNHEFNFGLPFLEQSLHGAPFPFVCANLQRVGGRSFLPPSMVLTRTVHAEDGTAHALRVGVIGFVPPQIMIWDKTKLTGHVTTDDIVETAERLVPALRKRCDILIALCHAGISATPRTVGAENAALYLAKVPGIDVIFTGHSHRVFPSPDYAGLEDVDAVRGTLAGIPAVMPGYWGSHLGKIDLVLEQASKAWKIADFKVEAQPIYRREGATVVSLAQPEKKIEAAVETEHEATRAWVGRPVGRITGRLTSYLALVGDNAVMDLINRAQIDYTRPLLAGTKHAGLTILSAAAPFKSGGLAPDNYTDIAAGPVALRDMADIYVFPNTLAAVRLTGAGIVEWLERSSNVFLRADPAVRTAQPLIDPKSPGYNFDTISGLTWEIDITQPRRYDGGKLAAPDSHRIRDVRFEGKPIDPAREFVVVTNNYRADGGGGFPGLGGDAVILRAPDANRDALVRYFEQTKDVPVPSIPSWRFAKQAEPLLLSFETAPAAKDLLAGRPDLKWTGPAEKGWDRFELTV
jgi:2',3'-cyclic-nucleotide 2'-phosphodiesterase / 3'-nucleotidase